MADEITSVQQWRMDIAKDVEQTNGEVRALAKEQVRLNDVLEDISKNLSAYNKNVDDRMDIAKDLSNAINRRGWVAIGLSFFALAAVLVAHLGFTMGGIASGVSGIAGMIASVRKVI